VREGETVVDMFAGVGPFSIEAAKTHETVSVFAIDANPSAVGYLKKNIRVNGVVGKVHPILGDARQVIQKRLTGVADRVIMNLPESAIQFVGVACQAVKPSGGIVHFYSFVKEPDSMEILADNFTRAVEDSGCCVEEILHSKRVRETAPYEWQAVLDARVS
jgi:tRNA (guanine37-N1)-methyltransferase